MNLVRASEDTELAESLMHLACDHLRRRVVTLPDSPPETEWPVDIDYIAQCLLAALSHVDGPQSTIRRALLTQGWSLFLDAFPPVVEIPLAPVQSINSIQYLDEDGAWQTMDPLLYRLSGAHSWQPEISPAHGESWPATLAIRDSIEISFNAGYGDAHTKIPNAILQAVLELTAHFYTERQPVVFGSPYELPLGVKRLLQPYKVFR
jgi:uncharacterized phiE125 gp8 family phage protein